MKMLLLLPVLKTVLGPPQYNLSQLAKNSAIGDSGSPEETIRFKLPVDKINRPQPVLSSCDFQRN
jgi:hypothetical protein